MRVVLFGGGGMLGTDIAAGAPRDAVVTSHGSLDTDVADANAVARALDEAQPDWVVNAAAYTKVDQAESEPDEAHRVNAIAPGVIGVACAARGVRVVHFSTDYIFPGDTNVPRREDDAANPLNRYGQTKLAGERQLLASGADVLIVRTAWLFGRHGKSFPRTMWERATARQHTKVVADQDGRPTYTVDLAAATWALMAANARGVVHASNSGPQTTWFGIAQQVFALAGVPELLQPCTTAEYPTPARRPRNSALDTTRLESMIGPLPRWDDALARFLQDLRLRSTTRR